MPDDTPPQPGVLLLASRILDDSAALTGLAFARWGEETCIPSIQATGGVSRTLRYESLSFMKQHRSAKATAANVHDSHQPENINFAYDFLDIYFMSDVNFSNSKAFRQLPIIGDVDITSDMEASKLFERLLMLTEFDVRFCVAVDPEASGISRAATPAPFLITIVKPSGDELSNSIESAGKIIGRYQVRDESTLSAMERSQPSESSYGEVILLACNSLRNFSTPELANHLEIGIWGLRKQYSGQERKAAAWRPGVRI